MGGAANPELGRRILREIALSTNQPLRHEAKTHPFWTSLNLKQIPDEIIIATSSFRKIALFALQLLALNGEEMPPFFKELADDPLKLLKSLKSAFHNGNNESTGKYFIGEIFGVPVVAEATEGETHKEGATQYQEARNKAEWLAAQNLSDGSGNAWYLAVDTLDSTRVLQSDGSYLELPALPKPSGWPDFPKDYDTNIEGYDAFKRKVIGEKFPEGAILQGLTAGVIINTELDELAAGYVSVEAEIRRERLLEMIGEFDHNASGFGVLQLLIDWQIQSGLDEDRELLQMYFEKELSFSPGLTEEHQKLAAFFLLAQIMGAPSMLVLELIRSVPGTEEDDDDPENHPDDYGDLPAGIAGLDFAGV